MSVIFNRKLIANPHQFTTFFPLGALVHGFELVSVPKDHVFRHSCTILGRPIPYFVFDSFFSSLSSRYDCPSSYLSVSFSTHDGGRNDFYDKNDGFGKFRQMGTDNGECNTNDNPEIDGFDEFGEEEEEDERDGGNSDVDESGFLDLNSVEKNCDETEDIWRIEVEEEEFQHPLVREICRLIGLRPAWTPKLEGEMRRLLRSLNPRLVCAVLRSQSDERVALDFFYWAGRQWRYRHDPIVYYMMLQVLRRTKLCQGARRVLRLMVRRGIARRPEAFAHVMVSYSRAGKLRNAMQILTMMQKAGIEPNLMICNTAIHVLVMANKLDKALRFFERMQLVGIMPNVVTYNCLIKGYCEQCQVEDALDLIAEMPCKGCSPDKVSCHTVISFFCKEKRIKDVKDLMEKMLKDNKLLPDQVTYNTIIHVLSRHGHPDEALDFLREAEERGFQVDKVGYSAIVNSLCQQGRMDRAKEVVNEMITKDCCPDVVTYTAVVNGFCKVNKLDEAKTMLQQMYKHGCKPNTVSYTALLNGFCQHGNSLEARDMIKTSEENWWTPNAITYSVVMHGLRQEGKLSEACDVVREMLMKGFFPTPVEINQLIRSLCLEGRMEESKGFMEECLKRGCAVNVVNFTTVIHGFCKKGDVDAALSLLDDMYLNNKHPDTVTFTTIIDALGKKGRIEEATEFTMKMLKKGLDPTPVTYRTVIHHYCKMGRVDELMTVLDKMLIRKNCRTAYNQVIEKLCYFRNVEAADKLIGKVLRTASKIDANTCHMLMESYLSKGIPLSAYRVACRMFNRNLIPDLKLCEKLSKQLVLEGKLEEADKLMLRLVERGNIPPCSMQNSQI